MDKIEAKTDKETKAAERAAIIRRNRAILLAQTDPEMLCPICMNEHRRTGGHCTGGF